MAAIKTKNKKIMTKEKRVRRVSEDIQENGRIERRLSEVARCDGVEKEIVINLSSKRDVRVVEGEEEFIVSLGASVEMYTKRISMPPKKIKISKYENQKMLVK